MRESSALFGRIQKTDALSVSQGSKQPSSDFEFRVLEFLPTEAKETSIYI